MKTPVNQKDSADVPALASAARWFSQVPQWFAAVAALIYGSGFLIEMSFLDSFGIRGATQDIFKARYLFVGFLFLQWPVSMIALILAYSTLKRLAREAAGKATRRKRRSPNDDEKLEHLHIFSSSVWMMVILLTVFYLLVAFGTPGSGSEKQPWIGALFCFVLVGIVLIREVERLITTPEARMRFGKNARLVCLSGAAVLAIWIAFDILPRFLEMIVYGGYLCYGMWLLIGYILHRLMRRAKEVGDEGYTRPASVITICLCAAMLYLSAMFFGYRVYPYIPARKGGGDFTEDKAVILHFDERFDAGTPKALRGPEKLTSKPVIIIDESQSAIHCTLREGAQPREWRLPGVSKKPDIMTVNRAAVSFVETAPASSK